MNYGEIYLVDFNKSVGHEYEGKRPGIIIESDNQLKTSNIVTIIALTSKIDNHHHDDILIKMDNRNRLNSDSLIKVNHIESFDRSRFSIKIGIADKETLEKIKKYLKKHFDL